MRSTLKDRQVPDLRDMETIIRFLWPRTPSKGLSEALSVPHSLARDWLSGYRVMPADKVMGLLGLYNSVFFRGQRVLQDYADKRAREDADKQERAKHTRVQARQKPANNDLIKL